MKKRLRSEQEDDGGLDSLLDTMTNVVGILVLVLIVAQLGVADVVNRVVTQNRVDDQTIESARRRLTQKQVEQQELKQILYEPFSIDVDQLREQLARNKELLERRKKLLAEKEAAKNQYAAKIEQDREQADKNRQAIEAAEAQRSELEQLISASLEQKAQLEAMLEETPRGEAPADIEVSIPNPRPAPPGAQQLLLICAHNKLYPVNAERFRTAAEAKAKQLITRYKLLQDPTAGIDAAEFTERFQRLKDQDDFFDVEYYVQDNKHPRLRMIPRVDRGGTVKEVSNRRSRVYKRWLAGIDPTKHYARFIVLPDSFEVYTITRRAFADAGVLAGWQPVGDGWVYTASIPGNIVLGPPPEPKPKPTTPPPKPTPPAKPPKPPNLID